MGSKSNLAALFLMQSKFDFKHKICYNIYRKTKGEKLCLDESDI